MDGGSDRLVTIFLCGDVMTGRGVDQILAQPGDPRLWEGYVRDARTYVDLAEVVNGPIRRPVDDAWPWGDALTILDRAAPDARVINLETAITRSDDAATGKAVLYRMNPANIACLTVARPDVCALANNHLLDFGRQGLRDTLKALSAAGIATAGAGLDTTQAHQPAAVPVAAGRVVVHSVGTASSGIPGSWAATPDQPGVDLLPDLSDTTAGQLIARVRRARRPGDVTVVSIHWGSNWDYEVPAAHVRFAHRLADGGVDIVHGHSSHHPRPIEVYHGRLILYGCGDFIDDYEGISGHEEYRDDLRLAYLVSVRPDSGGLASLRMAVLQARNMRLHQAGGADVGHVRGVLARISRPFGTQVAGGSDGMLHLLAASP